MTTTRDAWPPPPPPPLAAPAPVPPQRGRHRAYTESLATRVLRYFKPVEAAIPPGVLPPHRPAVHAPGRHHLHDPHPHQPPRGEQA